MANQAAPPEVMTQSKWLEIVQANKDALRTLIKDYHPASRGHAPSATITAPNAEIACAGIRDEIAREDAAKAPPVERFDKALADGDVGLINTLLNAAWFGVPESTECWHIPGFGVACDLMDDLPEEPS
jgi:hypothetical protein